MNGFKSWLLLVASVLVLVTRVATAQIVPGKERDFGWSINQNDGVLEYIVQIKPEEIVAMQQRSVKYPNGQEDASDMPRELVGRATRVVIRIGNEILPRTPSIEELDRMPRVTDPLNPTSTAMLPPGRMQDVESGVYNIQQRDAAPSLPDLPSGLNSNLSSRGGNLIDEASKAAGGLLDNVNALRNNANESLSSALPSFPDTNTLAQNTQQPGASDFLNSARGGNSASGSKYNSLPTSNSPALPPANSANTPSLNPNLLNPNTANPNLTNNSTMPNRNPGTGGIGTGGTNSFPGFPDSRLNPPSLGSQSTLPQQQTPAPGFGTPPNPAGRNNNAWANSNSTAPNYTSSPDPYASSTNYQPNYNNAAPNQFGSAPQTNPNYMNPNFDRLAMSNNPPPINSAANNSALNNQSQTGRNLPAGSSPPTNLTNLNADIVPATKIDGVVQVLFLLSLVVNFYLGILIRKLLIRYRSLLTNVRQAAYT